MPADPTSQDLCSIDSPRATAAGQPGQVLVDDVRPDELAQLVVPRSGPFHRRLAGGANAEAHDQHPILARARAAEGRASAPQAAEQPRRACPALPRPIQRRPQPLPSTPAPPHCLRLPTDECPTTRHLAGCHLPECTNDISWPRLTHAVSSYPLLLGPLNLTTPASLLGQLPTVHPLDRAQLVQVARRPPPRPSPCAPLAKPATSTTPGCSSTCSSRTQPANSSTGAADSVRTLAQKCSRRGQARTKVRSIMASGGDRQARQHGRTARRWPAREVPGR
jgi:hypothetical protein